LEDRVCTHPWSDIQDEWRGGWDRQIRFARDDPLQQCVEKSVEDVHSILIEPQPLPLDLIKQIVQTSVHTQGHDSLDSVLTLAICFDGKHRWTKKIVTKSVSEHVDASG
jgi:hypothetical protein